MGTPRGGETTQVCKRLYFYNDTSVLYNIIIIIFTDSYFYFFSEGLSGFPTPPPPQVVPDTLPLFSEEDLAVLNNVDMGIFDPSGDLISSLNP